MRMSQRYAGFLVVGIFCATAVLAHASQHRRGPRGFRGTTGDRMGMLRELDLTEAQRSSVRALFERARNTGTQERLLAAKRALQEAVEQGEADEATIGELAYQVGIAEGEAALERMRIRAELREILTDEQRHKLDALEAERRKESEERRQRFEERRQKRRGSGEPFSQSF